MNNYKIKVNNEAESKEAQELFFELGYKFEFFADIQACRQSEAFGFPYFVQANEFGQILFAIGQLEKAKELTLPQLRDLVAQSKPTEQGLISGADALRALADGEEVLWRTKTNAEVKSFRKQTPDLDLVLSGDCNYRFWIKPCTIRIELEIPACGKNYKHGQLIWILNSLEPKEYCSVILDESDELPAYWWETEEEIKQVVAALRGGIKA